MRKHFLFTVILSCMTLLFGLASCSNDDEPSGEKPSNAPSSSIITNVDGDKILLSSVKGKYESVNFNYDQKGRVEEINYGYEDIQTIDYEEGTMYFDGLPIKFTVTSQGYIKTMSVDFSLGKDYIKLKYNFGYDGAGQLTNLDVSFDTKEEDYSSKGSANIKYTWNSGNLVSTIMKGKEEGWDEDGSFKENFTTTCTAEYGKTNTCLQPTIAFNSMTLGSSGIGCDSFINALSGMVGKAPNDLCTKLYIDYNDESDENENLTFSYTLNDDGTIYKETVKGTDNDTYTYSYKGFSSSRSAAPVYSINRKSDSEIYETLKNIIKTQFRANAKF